MTIGLILLALAVIFLIPAYIQYKKIQLLLKTGITTTAKIIDVHESQTTSTDADGFTTTTETYKPEIEFKTETGETVRYTSQISTSNKNTWKIGDTVEIVYDPNNLKNIKIKKTMQLYFLPILLGFFSLILLIIGLVFILTA